MPRKSPKPIYMLPDGTRLPPETFAGRSGLDIKDPTIAAAIADVNRAEEHLKQLARKQSRQKQQRPDPTDSWKWNPFYEGKVYDGQTKKMRERSFKEQSPEFHVIELVRAGMVSLDGLVNYMEFCNLKIDRQTTLVAVEHLMLPWHPKNGNRCLVALACDADGDLILAIKYMVPPLAASHEQPDEPPTLSETCEESKKPPLEPNRKPDEQKKREPSLDYDFNLGWLNDDDIFA